MERLITYMKDPYALSIEIKIALSKICLRRIILSVKENLSNTITSDIFPTRGLNYNLRSQSVV